MDDLPYEPNLDEYPEQRAEDLRFYHELFGYRDEESEEKEK